MRCDRERDEHGAGRTRRRPFYGRRSGARTAESTSTATRSSTARNAATGASTTRRGGCSPRISRPGRRTAGASRTTSTPSPATREPAPLFTVRALRDGFLRHIEAERTDRWRRNNEQRYEFGPRCRDGAVRRVASGRVRPAQAQSRARAPGRAHASERQDAEAHGLDDQRARAADPLGVRVGGQRGTRVRDGARGSAVAPCAARGPARNARQPAGPAGRSGARRRRAAVPEPPGRGARGAHVVDRREALGAVRAVSAATSIGPRRSGPWRSRSTRPPARASGARCSSARRLSACWSPCS